MALDRNAQAPQRYGALNMTAALGPFIMRHPEVKGNMEQFMLQHVLPEFASTDPYMRAIVCPKGCYLVRHLIEFLDRHVRLWVRSRKRVCHGRTKRLVSFQRLFLGNGILNLI